MSTQHNPVVGGYSDLAAKYDSAANLQSCWGKSTEKILSGLSIPKSARLVADVGCGTGHELLALATRASRDVSFVGIEPAAQMRERAEARTRDMSNVRILDGSFEHIPLDQSSVDYLYSVYAFHWTTDPERSAQEIHRVLKEDGAMDLVFVGPDNGVEFNKVTTPIVRQYMGRAYMLAAGKMQRQISREMALQLFAPLFSHRHIEVEESRETYYDTLDGHWGWRVRIEGHFSKIPTDKRQAFDAEVRSALQSIATDQGIPYTIHQIHVSLAS